MKLYVSVCGFGLDAKSPDHRIPKTMQDVSPRLSLYIQQHEYDESLGFVRGGAGSEHE